MDTLINLLIIDDSEDDRLFYRRILQKSEHINYQISEAINGTEGIKKIHEKLPNCILLDYSMPGFDGVDILKEIRASFPFVAIVMLTGQGNEKIAVNALHNGAQNYIAKTNINLETLENVIQLAIDHCMMQKYIHEQHTSLEIFSRALAHDLKEPTRTICSFLKLIEQNEILSDKGKEYFDFVQKAAARMVTLIETVFSYTQLDTKNKISKENCNMMNLLNDVKENLRLLITERNTTIIYDNLPEVYANQAQLIEVLQNLIANAINHNAPGITIHVDISEEPEQWLFKISDNGHGIKAEFLEKIFEPFKRLSSQKTPGAGLGLAICKKVIEFHQGKIWCESIPEQKTTFNFTFPKRNSDQENISEIFN